MSTTPDTLTVLRELAGDCLRNHQGTATSPSPHHVRGPGRAGCMFCELAMATLDLLARLEREQAEAKPKPPCASCGDDDTEMPKKLHGGMYLCEPCEDEAFDDAK